MIKKIRVKNFKSFKDLELSLGKVNILVGANASGKSNFVEIFRFLRDIAKHGLVNAISMHGGTEYIKNINIDYDEFLSFEIVYSESALDIPYQNKKILEESYSFAIKFDDDKLNFNIVSNLHEPYLSLKKIFDKISIYDFNPKFSKEAVPIFAKMDLEEDGRNLVIAVKKILDDPEKKRMFMNLVSYLLPYVEDIKVDKFTETHYYLGIKETYSDKHYLPAPLISDGTINALGLVVALYFQESPLIIIEEPDKGFHPSIISSVVEMMKDATKYTDKQIIVTTHNPEMVRYADMKNIFLVSRSENGFSSIVKPFRKRDVKIFLENGLRPEELYVDNLLEM